MNQKSVQSFESECGKARVYVESDMPIGVFHDFLLKLKGNMVDRMVAAQKEEQAISDAQKERSECSSECSE